MSAEVLSLVPSLPQHLAEAECIEMLECLLQAAKNGEIICAAVAALRPNGTAALHISETEHGLPLLGAVHCLSDSITEDLRNK